jgi:hypothetical protein
MKWFFIFILFFIVGVGLVIGYTYWNHQNPFNVLPSPITTKFSLENAPEDSLKGTIASMSGTVNWQSRTAGHSVRLQSPRMIQQGEELSTGKNSIVRVVVQKAEEIIEFPDSHITFIQMLPINVVISQDAGSVFYENTGLSAMTVKTLDLVTSVNRAWVTISLDQSTDTVTVTPQKESVTEGYLDSEGNSNTVIIKAGQQFVFDDTTQTGSVE